MGNNSCNERVRSLRIVLTSHSYAPSVGGIETVSQLLAKGLRGRGHEVQVLTETPLAAANSAEAEETGVLRHPSLLAAWRAFLGADVILQCNIGVRRLWLPLLLGKPVLIVIHTWVHRPDGSLGWQDHLKRWLLRRVRNCAAVSRALATHIGPDCTVLPNPYNSDLFQCPEHAAARPMRAHAVFLGRLVSDKGCDLAISALRALRARGINLHLTVIGTGPEEDRLREHAAELRVADSVVFLGALRGTALVEQLAKHSLLLAPSRWAEPFGLVALEALAIGLVPVVSQRGGFPEAVGPFGFTFESGSVTALADAIFAALRAPPLSPIQREQLAKHLALHQPGPVIDAYERELRRALKRA